MKYGRVQFDRDVGGPLRVTALPVKPDDREDEHTEPNAMFYWYPETVSADEAVSVFCETNIEKHRHAISEIEGARAFYFSQRGGRR